MEVPRTTGSTGRVSLWVLGAAITTAFAGSLIVWHSTDSWSEGLPSRAADDCGAASAPLHAVPVAAPPVAGPEANDAYAKVRRRMIERHLYARDIRDPRVLEAMERVPRHRFVPKELLSAAYEDHPLPIGHDQTISQPYVVALMTELVAPKPTSRALDVGTGSGYQAAVLSVLCKEVFSIEIVPPLADEAAKRLKELGYANVAVRCGDGYRGWPEHAPFDVIVLAASPNHVPQALVDQLAPGGRLVLPIGGYPQELTVIEKRADGSLRHRSVAPVLFVPMTGEAERRR